MGQEEITFDYAVERIFKCYDLDNDSYLNFEEASQLQHDTEGKPSNAEEWARLNHMIQRDIPNHYSPLGISLECFKQTYLVYKMDWKKDYEIVVRLKNL